MKKVFLPDQLQNPKERAFSEPEELLRFRQQSKALEERADRMRTSSSDIPRKEIVALARDTYALAASLFETKLAKGEPLLPEEQAIYQLCKSEIQKYPESRTADAVFCQVTLSDAVQRKAHSNAVTLIGNCIDEINEWFELETEEADRCIVNAGTELLPHYAGSVKGFFSPIPELFVPFLTASAFDMLEAQAECALFYQDNGRAVNVQMASAMLTVAGYAHQGHSGPEGEYEQLSMAELPERIRPLYDESSGILTGSRGLRVWLGKKDGCIAVAYSGTDFKNYDMVYADIVQLSEPSILYLKAAGLLHLLLAHMPEKPFYVTGHSLGGGLAQFSLAANMPAHSDRLTGYAYNPAGLSMVSLRHLEADRLKVAAQNMWVFMTCHDIVSAIGGKIGCLTTLPETDQNGHSMEDLKACMKKYTEIQ